MGRISLQHVHHNNRMAMMLLMASLISAVCAFSSSNHKSRGHSRPLKETQIATPLNGNNIGGVLGAMRKVDATNDNDGGSDANHMTTNIETRRKFMASMTSIGLATAALTPWQVAAEDSMPTALSEEVQALATGDIKKLFNEGRALEAQGNILAAQRLYTKVTKIAPRFIYGWSNLGNTLVAQGQLGGAEESYSKAISLCEENLKQTEGEFGVKRCDDLYLILLNRGSVRLNNDMPKEALLDLLKSNNIRARPDAVILQNLVRDVLGKYFFLV